MANKNPSPATRFKPGNRANPGGKPVEARNRITAKFLYELAEHFDKHGKDAIQTLYETDVAKYVSAVAALVPKESDVNVNHSGAVAHEHVAISATVEWLRGVIGERADRASPEPLPN